MLIRVEQKHIDRGVKGDCNKCPIALAILDSFENNESFQFTPQDLEVSIEICAFGIELGGRPYVECGRISSGVEEFIDNFDWDKSETVPTEMLLDLEKEVLTLLTEG